MITFNPDIKTIGSVERPSIRELREEQKYMLHSASIKYVIREGGLLANTTLNTILPILKHKFELGWNEDYPVWVFYKSKKYYLVIDTKVVMLMPGMYPSIPGWHCDAVPRKDVNGQADLTKLDEDQYHFICTASNIDNGSLTEFIDHSLGNIPNYHENVWKQLSELLNKPHNEHSLYKTKAKNCDIIQFNQPTLHRATPAKEREFRFFFRLSMYHKPPQNKKRHQVQVYVDKDGGW